jgi:uncharacterized protein (DUF1800 family)
MDDVIASASTAAGQKGSADSIFASGFETPPPEGPPLAVRVLNKAAYGPRPGDIAAFNALGANDDARMIAWVDRQLDPDAITDSACDARIAAAAYSTIAMTVPQLWATHVRGSTAAGGPAAWPRRYYPAEEAYCIKLIRAVYSERQLYEVMVDFWHSHFNVMGWDFGIAPVFMQYDRDVMRGTRPVAGGKRYALGNFRALLEEVAKSPAMLMYLDNKSSTRAGFNENFARELCELHTLGAENYYPGNDPIVVPDADDDDIPDGYCDNDVYEAARALTGWTISDAHWEFPDLPEYDTGEFRYYPGWHDPAAKYFIGTFMVANQAAMVDGRRIFDILAQHPGTARHICGKLCRRLVGDNASAALIQSAADEWRTQWQAQDQIARVVRLILLSPEFRQTWGEKVKRPWEAVMHALRATSAEFTPKVRPVSGWNAYVDFNDRIVQTGNGPWRWPTPDGFPDTASKWQSVSPLSQTWRLFSRLVEMRDTTAGDPPFFARIEQQTKAALATNARTATAIVDLWIGRLFGYEIDAARRQLLIDFLRQNATATTVLNLDEDDTDSGQPAHRGTWNGGNLSRHYSIARLRSMVALMLMIPEFFHR